MNSKQQEMENDLLGCLLSYYEKILKWKEISLVFNSLTISSVTHANTLSWSKLANSVWLVKFILFTVGCNKWSRTRWCLFQFSPSSSVKFNKVTVPLFDWSSGSYISSRGLYLNIKNVFELKLLVTCVQQIEEFFSLARSKQLLSSHIVMVVGTDDIKWGKMWKEKFRGIL